VKISDNLLQVMSLQEGHGGWIPEMQSVCDLFGTFYVVPLTTDLEECEI